MSIESFKPNETRELAQSDSYDIDERIDPEQTSLEQENSDDKYDIDKRIGDIGQPVEEKKTEEKYDIDKRIEDIGQPVEKEKTETQEDDVFCENTELFSTLGERIAKTPAENSKNGEWEADRGNSTFIPSDSETKKELKKYGLNGIEYKNGIPDFSKVADTTVKIDNMTSKRLGPGNNYNQADVAAAKKWSEEKRDDRSDWSAREVEAWRTGNNMSWHERSDMKTMDLVPSNIHTNCSHSGGVSECAKRDKQEVTFDA